MNPALTKLGINHELQAVRLITQLEEITELLASAIKGDPTLFPTQAAAQDHAIAITSASSQLAQIAKNLGNPPSQPVVPTSNQ